MFTPSDESSSSGNRIRTWAAMFAIAATMSITFAGSVSADDWGGPMTFSIGKWGGWFDPNDPGIEAIFADGDITADTPAHFEKFLRENDVAPGTYVTLNSHGGNLYAGMRLGQIIREHGLNTAVGSEMPTDMIGAPLESFALERYYPGYCISACTLTYLGGNKRQMLDDNAHFAVHQVSLSCHDPNDPASPLPDATDLPDCPPFAETLAMTQEISADIIRYLQTMGVDSAFFVEMSKATPKQQNRISRELMERYGIVTPFEPVPDPEPLRCGPGTSLQCIDIDVLGAGDTRTDTAKQMLSDAEEAEIFTEWVRAFLPLDGDMMIPDMRAGYYLRDSLEAYKMALATGKPLILVMVNRYCWHCATLIATSLTCSGVNRFAQFAIFAIAEPGDMETYEVAGKVFADALEVRGYPTITIIEPDPDRILERARIEGYFTGAALSAYLEQVLAPEAAGRAISEAEAQALYEQNGWPHANCDVDPYADEPQGTYTTPQQLREILDQIAEPRSD